MGVFSPCLHSCRPGHLSPHQHKRKCVAHVSKTLPIGISPQPLKRGSLDLGGYVMFTSKHFIFWVEGGWRGLKGLRVDNICWWVQSYSFGNSEFTDMPNFTTFITNCASSQCLWLRIYFLLLSISFMKIKIHQIFENLNFMWYLNSIKVK